MHLVAWGALLAHSLAGKRLKNILCMLLISLAVRAADSPKAGVYHVGTPHIESTQSHVLGVPEAVLVLSDTFDVSHAYPMAYEGQFVSLLENKDRWSKRKAVPQCLLTVAGVSSQDNLISKSVYSRHWEIKDPHRSTWFFDLSEEFGAYRSQKDKVSRGSLYKNTMGGSITVLPDIDIQLEKEPSFTSFEKIVGSSARKFSKMSSKANRFFISEMLALHSLKQATGNLNSLRNDIELLIINLYSLDLLVHEYGYGKQYNSALNIFKNILEEEVSTKGTTNLVVVTVPPTTGSSMQKRDDLSTFTTFQYANCHDTENQCIESTNNCSSHGTCTRKSMPDQGPCWSCECSSINSTSWVGEMCERKDISSPFHLLFWVSLKKTTRLHSLRSHYK